MSRAPPFEEMFGLIRVRVLPPRQLYLPVLPKKIKVTKGGITNEKLLFALCHRCAKNRVENGCTHTDKQREFTGIYFTEEVAYFLK